MDINYERLEWEDFPSTETPINADNLNHLEEGIAGLYAERYEMQSNIAYVEDGETASKDYLPNSYLMRDGLFYKVTKTILYGDSFDSGEDGNIEHVDVSSQFGSGGGGSTGCVELTQAQYDALSDEAKMLDVIYLITDSPDNYLDEVFGDFASVEYTDTASKAYAVGDYLVYDNKFYKVTSAIAQGGTITVGTNVARTTVGDEFRKRGKVMTSSSVQAFLTDLGDLANGDSRFYFIPWRSVNTQDGLDAQNTFVFGTKNDAVINAIAISLTGNMYTIDTNSSTWALKNRPWKELTGLTINTTYEIPSQYTEVYFRGQFQSGQVIGIHIPLPPSGTIRKDSGFYYTSTANGSGGAYLGSNRIFNAYKPYFGGAEVNYAAFNLYAR